MLVLCFSSHSSHIIQLQSIFNVHLNPYITERIMYRQMIMTLKTPKDLYFNINSFSVIKYLFALGPCLLYIITAPILFYSTYICLIFYSYSITNRLSHVKKSTVVLKRVQYRTNLNPTRPQASPKLWQPLLWTHRVRLHLVTVTQLINKDNIHEMCCVICA